MNIYHNTKVFSYSVELPLLFLTSLKPFSPFWRQSSPLPSPSSLSCPFCPWLLLILTDTAKALSVILNEVGVTWKNPNKHACRVPKPFLWQVRFTSGNKVDVSAAFACDSALQRVGGQSVELRLHFDLLNHFTCDKTHRVHHPKGLTAAEKQLVVPWQSPHVLSQTHSLLSWFIIIYSEQRAARKHPANA